MNRDKNSFSQQYPEPGDIYDSYRIEAFADEDPTGRTFQAYDSSLGGTVSLKVLSEQIGQKQNFIDVLRIQLEAVRAINDTGLAPAITLGNYRNQFFFTYEWGGGGRLSHEIAKQGKIPLDDALQIVLGCAETLQSGAKKGIFHGNLKPSNILFMKDRKVKIAEMGFASAARAIFGASDLPVYLGSARFLAPEMINEGPVDFRADIFSLGMIFYYILFNRVPFRYEGQKLVAEENDPVEVSRRTLDVISKMIEKNPAARYQDYSLLIEDLRDLQVSHIQIAEVPVVGNLLGRGIKSPNLFKLLCALFVSGISGVLTVTAEETQRKFYLRNRLFVFFESNRIEDAIWSWLVKKKEIDPSYRLEEVESFQEALNRVLLKGVRLEDFKYRYQELANQLFVEVLKWNSPDAEFANAEIKNGALCEIRLSDTLIRAVKLCVPFQDVVGELKTDSVLVRTPLFETLVNEFKFSPNESQLIVQSHEGIHIGTLLVTAGTIDEKVLRFLYLLKQIGMLEIKTVVQEKKYFEELEPEPAFERQVPEEPALTSSGERSREPLAQELRAIHEPVRMEVQKTFSKIEVSRLDMEAEKRFEFARNCYENQKYWEAANYCEQAIGIHEDARYYWLMGLSYAHHPKFRAKAEDCFHHAIHIDPLNDQLHTGLAEFYVDNGLLLRARTHCEMAIKIVPDQERALELLYDLQQKNLGIGGCPCEHKPGCHHKH